MKLKKKKKKRVGYFNSFFLKIHLYLQRLKKKQRSVSGFSCKWWECFSHLHVYFLLPLTEMVLPESINMNLR